MKSVPAEFMSSREIHCSSPAFKLRIDETGREVQMYISGGGELSSPTQFLFVASLLVTDKKNDAVHMFDVHHGAYLKTLIRPKEGGLSMPEGVQYGPDSNVYVASSGTDKVLKFNAANGQFIGVFASLQPKCQPKDILFGPDGNLFVACHMLNKVLAYNAQSGQMLGVAAQGGNLRMPYGLAFGQGSQLYVVSAGTRQVLMFAQGGYFQGAVNQIKDASTGIAFHAGRLYIVGGQESGHAILTVDGDTAIHHAESFQLHNPVGLAFDNVGYMLVGSNDAVRRFTHHGQMVSTMKPYGYDMEAAFVTISPRDPLRRPRQHTEL
jgi:DNA-binding beta-propeller fold protein YncE